MDPGLKRTAGVWIGLIIMTLWIGLPGLAFTWIGFIRKRNRKRRP